MLKHNDILHIIRSVLPFFANRTVLSIVFVLEQNLRQMILKLFNKGSERGIEYHLVTKYLWPHLINATRQDFLLDIGSGDSLFPSRLAGKSTSVVGLDLKVHRVQHHLNMVEGDALELPFKSDSFKYVTMISVIEHIEKKGRCLQEVERILIKGGEAIITTPIEPDFWHPEVFAQTLNEVFLVPQLQYFQIANYNLITKAEAINLFGQSRILSFAVVKK